MGKYYVGKSMSEELLKKGVRTGVQGPMVGGWLRHARCMGDLMSTGRYKEGKPGRIQLEKGR